MTPRQDDEILFQFRLWPVYRFALIFTPIAVVAYTAIRNPDRLYPSFLAIAIGVAVPVALVLLSALPWLMPVRVRLGSIVGHNAFGTKREARWDEIAEVDTFSVGGIRYWRLKRPSGKRPVLIPKFLSDPVSFAELVAERAGAENPLTLAVNDS